MHRSIPGGLVLAGFLTAMRTDSPVLDGHGLTPGPAVVDERGPGVVMSSADFIRGWSYSWPAGHLHVVSAGSTFAPHMGLVGCGCRWCRWQCGAGGCGASMVEVSGAAAARLRFAGGGRRAGWVPDSSLTGVGMPA